MISIFKTKNCPRCKELRNEIDKYVPSSVEELDIETDPAALTELRVNGIFVLEMPVLRVGEDWYLPGELFGDGRLDRKKVGEIFKK